MNEISIICCWNNELQIKKFESSLDEQSISCDRIFLDNRRQRFKSCSVALNYGIKQVKTKFLIFAHQDICMDRPDTLYRLLNYLKRINKNDILGVSGAFEKKDYVKTNIRIGNDLRYGSPYRVNDLEKCFSVDECLFGGYTERFRNRNFDEKICDDWHLYAVEQCIYNLVNKADVYVCGIELIHFSAGNTNHQYNIGLKRLCKAYDGKIKTIYTPCCFECDTDVISRNLYYLKNELGLVFKRKKA